MTRRFIRYTTMDGTEYIIRGNKARPLIEALRADMWTDPGSNEAYMRRLGNLVASLYGTVIDIENEKRFVQGLVELGILEKEKK